MKKHLGIILISFLVSACSIQVSKIEKYEEPSVSSRYGVIKLKNDSFAEHLVGDIIRKPNNKLSFYKIDDQIAPYSDTLRLSPGQHRLIITCSTSNRLFGEKRMTLNVLPGRTYEIAYPENLYGYDIDYTACQKLIIRSY